jgi:regulator of nucleoside diphosphate kinase
MHVKQRVITETDFDRLNELIGSPRHRVAHPAPVTNLRGELDRGVVVPPTQMPGFVVTMNSRVRVRDLETLEMEEFTLCYPEGANLAEDRVSVLAPMGTAMLGARVGETVEFSAPAGSRRFKVEEIVYQPEAEGHYYL